MKNTCYLCDKQVETEELEIGQYPICDECVKRMENEDKLDPTANTEAELMEVVRNYGIENQKLENKLATAVEALKRITEIPEQEEYFDCEECISMMEEAAEQALAEIGGEDD
ncbi:hypothetical protein V6B05_01435 [Lactococcus garvieae]|uniref:hypothetical protein n=1 Tax=Lactococcus garvieae TaxID=1363 RepID=UPI001F6220BB|nr:hypothetical protein [Lactococcus garvieae]MCI3860089.1 hypothetical protein [Lactococcus garvieae]